MNDSQVNFFPFKDGMKIPEDFEYEENHKDIINFFNKKASQCSREFIAKIFVMKNTDNVFLGYIALSICSIGKQDLKTTKAKGLYERPAIKIGQLIIDKKHQNKGYGSMAIRFVTSIAMKWKAFIPCRLIVVDAIDESAKEFYKKKNFHELTAKKDTLVLDLAPILKLK
ncbi:MAG: GNAT family N-acetyltransferase [Candidatus Peregrinibacteria bacterium]|nr:GNAT family N-acetyltransferase [Candidatus Peregrinibacteria bacterium]